MLRSEGRSPAYRSRRFGISLIAFAVVVLVMAVYVSIEVRSNLTRLKTASSDNIQWTLSQIDVEMLEFVDAVTRARYSDTPDLESIRQEFDILYSRAQTLSGSPVYSQIALIDAFSASLSATQDFLENTIALIDGPDQILLASLPRLHQQVLDLRPEVRKLAVVGLGRIAELSDRRRQAVANTLVRLADLTVLLFAALVGLVIYVLSIYRQTRRRGAALEQANQRMNTILTTSLDGVIVTDQSGSIIEFNSVAQEIFGVPATQARHYHIADLFVEDHLAALDGSGQYKTIGQGRVQLTGKHANGATFPVEISIQTAFDGRETLLVAFLRDISKRIADQDELVSARDHALAGEIAKSDFLTVMSHEIRTPLNGLLGNLSLLEETSLSKDQSKFIRNMEISGKVLSRHVDGVLDLARFEAGKVTYTLEPVDIAALVNDVIDGQTSLAHSCETTLEWRWVGTPVVAVQSNPRALEQVLLNLLGNAIKFAPDGRVTIEIEYEPGKTSEDGRLDIRVIDTGLGIPDGDLGKVFQDYVTRDTSHGRVTEGSGLGLGISRRIVETLGGEIGAESVEDIGSVFWFSLPARRANRLIPEAQDQKQARDAKPLDILMVEDNDINRDVAVEMLKRDGHKVTCAPDGGTGVTAAAHHAFDVILMDISMPVMDGFQAAQNIRSGRGASRNTPIIAVSANVLPSERHKFTRAGMAAFLSKPLNREALRLALSRVDAGCDTADPENEEAAAVIDLDHFNATRASLGPGILDELLSRFFEEMDHLALDLSARDLGQDDLARIAIAAHKAGGSASVFGAAGLRSVLRRIEAAAAASDLNAARAAVCEFDANWRMTRLALEISCK